VGAAKAPQAALKPVTLAPGHTLPVIGAEAISERLVSYAKAIRYVIDATAQAMNEGLGPDAIVARLHLPKQLAAKPWLGEHYGTFAWAARAYFAGTLVWFDGNPTNLDRMAPDDEAHRVVALASGPDGAISKARHATETGDHRWALQLLDRPIVLDIGAAEVGALKAKKKSACVG